MSPWIGEIILRGNCAGDRWAETLLLLVLFACLLLSCLATSGGSSSEYETSVLAVLLGLLCFSVVRVGRELLLVVTACSLSELEVRSSSALFVVSDQR